MRSKTHATDPAFLNAHYTQRINAAVAADLLDLVGDLTDEYAKEMGRIRKQSRPCR